jgi:hypothetical protein
LLAPIGEHIRRPASPSARKPIAKITFSLRRFLNLLRAWRIDSDFLDAVESMVVCVLLVYGALILNKCDDGATRFFLLALLLSGDSCLARAQ